MQISLNTFSLPISETSSIQPQEFNLSKAIYDLQNLESQKTEVSDSSPFSSNATAEKRKILQRTLNLQDSAQTLLNHFKNNKNTLSGSLASDTSIESLNLDFGDEKELISTIPELSGLTSGSLQVNGTVINIDINSDSLEDIITRINDSEAGVKLTYDYAEQTITINSLDRNLMLLDDGSSNFFSTLKLHEGYISGDQNIDEESFSVSADTQRYFNRFTARFNRLFESDFTTAGETDFREALIAATTKSIQSYIDPSFASGTIRLSSNVSMTVNSQLTQFESASISFESNDSPVEFINFLSSAHGLLVPYASLTDQKNQELKQSLALKNSNSLIISTKI